MQALKRLFRRLVWIAIILVIVAPTGLVLIYRIAPIPLTPLMVIRLFEGEGLSKDWTPIDGISAYVPEAVIAAEDNLFCRHWGIDWDALGSQIEAALEGERPRGASTISMQVAKNIFLWPERSYLRKILEGYLTLYVEALLPKRRILEIYLNVAEWGPGVYGIEAAAHHHFGKTAWDLSRREAALLAAILPSPREWRANPPDPYTASRAAILSARMSQIDPLLDCLYD